jgi:hypothetical protein
MSRWSGQRPRKANGAAQLPRFVCDLLGASPHRGSGLNFWLYRVARVLHPYRSSVEIVELLRAITAGEPVNHGEIERAVERSKATAWQPGQAPIAVAPAWPKLNREKRQAVIEASGAGLVDLWEVSPKRFEDNLSHTEEALDALFPGNPLLCCGRSHSDFDTRSREEWRGKLAGLAVIVPNPMTARIGRTQDGKLSAHTLETTGARRFLVIEQDSGSIDDQAAVLLHLAAQAPLAIAVHSGNKSIHGWFFCAGHLEERLQRFMRYAVTLGADPATWTRSQFVRIPGGTHPNGKQHAFFFLQSGGNQKVRAEIARDWTDGTDEWETPPREAPAQPISIRTPEEILAMPRDKHANFLGDRLLAKAQSLVIAGVGGIGKTRLLLQLLVAFIIGRLWCGIETHARERSCLLLQTENGMARLQRDLEALKTWAAKDWKLVEKNLSIHTLETEDDLLLHLSEPKNARRLEEAVRKVNPAIVSLDPLRDFGIGDLNSDADMSVTLRELGRIARIGNPDRALILLHHALTGRAGAAKGFGVERTGFGRGSKVLHSYARGFISSASLSAPSAAPSSRHASSISW